jgi:hypothetical protein
VRFLFASDIISYLNGISKDTPILRSWLGPKLCIMLNDPQLIKKVLTAPQLLKKPSFLYNIVGLPKGLICSPCKYPEPKKWLNKTSKITQAISIQDRF